jgi:hypothetical protein
MIRTMRRAVPVVMLVISASAVRAQGSATSRAVIPGAQATAPADTSAANVAPQTAPNVTPAPGPTREAAAVGVRAMKPGTPVDPVPAPKPAETRQNEALMIVGGAALIVGAVIGGSAGTLFMVGGACVGLFGLYKYLE